MARITQQTTAIATITREKATRISPFLIISCTFIQLMPNEIFILQHAVISFISHSFSFSFQQFRLICFSRLRLLFSFSPSRAPLSQDNTQNYKWKHTRTISNCVWKRTRMRYSKILYSKHSFHQTEMEWNESITSIKYLYSSQLQVAAQVLLIVCNYGWIINAMGFSCFLCKIIGFHRSFSIVQYTNHDTACVRVCGNKFNIHKIEALLLKLNSSSSSSSSSTPPFTVYFSCIFTQC